MRMLLLIIMCIIIAGCSGCARAKKPEVNAPQEYTELCKEALSLCWGKAGESPADVPYCERAFRCYDWELKKR